METQHRGRLAAIVLAAVTALGAVAIPAVQAQEAHDGHPPSTAAAAPPGGRVGVLLADHGEPPEYNAWTYESFREFFSHLIAMGVVPRWLTALETGTILYDADCPACEEPSDSPRLVDAWLRPHDGPAAFVPASDSLAAHYVVPGGPGFREPDIFEHVGLSAWDEWQRMGGRSPNYDEKLPKKGAVIDRLRDRYGDDVAVRIGYGIDPRIGGGRQGIREALDALVNRDRVESLVVVYHGVGFSDIMQTHHLRHQIAEHLASLDRRDMPVRYAEPLGTTDHYVAAVVDKVRSELAALPADAAVAVHLSGHGLPITTCGEYDCGADAYHRYAAALFARVKPAVEAAISRPGRTGVFHVYGDGGEGDADPDDEVTSPLEALDARAAEGWTHVVDIPYEFDSNSRDTLIVLRQGYRRPQPDWNREFESHFTRRGLHVKIANVNGGEAHKTDALHAVTVAAVGRPGDTNADPAPGEPARHLHAAAGARTAPAEVVHDPHEGGGDVHHAAATSAGSRHAEAPHHREDDTELAAGHRHTTGTASSTSGYLLVLLAAVALAAGVLPVRRPTAGRALMAAFALQLGGLGWDVLVHAREGEAVHLLENSGHWLAIVGLAATGVVGAALLWRPVSRG